jgi:hypothetical protein
VIAEAPDRPVEDKGWDSANERGGDRPELPESYRPSSRSGGSAPLRDPPFSRAEVRANRLADRKVSPVLCQRNWRR